MNAKSHSSKTKLFQCGYSRFLALVCLLFFFSVVVLYTPLFDELVNAEKAIQHSIDIQFLSPEALAKRLKVNDVQHVIQYWNNPDNIDKTPKPVNHEKFLTWKAWPAGLNNRRISFEVAYVFAWLLNRTLILPPINYMGARQGYPERLDYETIFEERDLRSGVPIMTAAEWEAYPSDKKIKILNDTFVVPWKIGNGNKTVFVVPKKIGPGDSKEENEEFDKWFGNRQEPKESHVVDQFTLGPRFLEASNIEFQRDHIFMHFYYAFYHRETSKFVGMNKLIRDHVHFPDKTTAFSATIVQLLGGPEGFSTMHFRRDDLQFETQRQVTPAEVFNTTYDYYRDNETIYVSTDEVPKVFDEEFCSIFGKRYNIVTLRNFSRYTLKAEKVYIPMIEMQIASQGRIFVGTQLSTFSMYITRMRGYSKHIQNKSYLMTTGWNWYHFPRHVDWDMEHEEAWDNLK